jgi:hypothetical protein
MTIRPHVRKKLPYDPLKDYEFITLAGVTPNILVVHPATPPKSVKDFISWVKANPGKIHMASAGVGSQSHLASAALAVAAGGLQPLHVPYSDADTGEQLRQFGPITPTASAVTIHDGEIFYGTGVGERSDNTNSDAYRSSFAPSPISAFCLLGAEDCPEEQCDDGDPCTYDFHGASGCETEAAPDGIPCGSPLSGDRCEGGACRART